MFEKRFSFNTNCGFFCQVELNQFPPVLPCTPRSFRRQSSTRHKLCIERRKHHQRQITRACALLLRIVAWRHGTFFIDALKQQSRSSLAAVCVNAPVAVANSITQTTIEDD